MFATSAVSPSPDAAAFADAVRAGMTCFTSRPAEDRKNRASASSFGALAVSPARSRTCPFQDSMSLAEALEIAPIRVNAASKSMAALVPAIAIAPIATPAAPAAIPIGEIDFSAPVPSDARDPSALAAPAVTPVVSIPRMISSEESVATGLLEGLALLERRLSGRGHLGDRRHLLDRLLDLLHSAQEELLEFVRLGVSLLVAVDVGERCGDQRGRPVRAGEGGTVLR